MKKIGSYTARGIVSEDQTAAGNPQKITLFDGSFKNDLLNKIGITFPVTDFNPNQEAAIFRILYFSLLGSGSEEVSISVIDFNKCGYLRATLNPTNPPMDNPIK